MDMNYAAAAPEIFLALAICVVCFFPPGLKRAPDLVPKSTPSKMNFTIETGVAMDVPLRRVGRCGAGAVATGALGGAAVCGGCTGGCGGAWAGAGVACGFSVAT